MFSKFFGIPAFTALLTIMTVACSSNAARPDPELVDEVLKDRNLQIAEEISQLMNFSIRGWQYVDRQHVILEDGPNRRVLLALSAPCHPLQNAHSIAFTSTVNSVTRNDRLLVRQGPGAPVNCYISRLYRLEKTSG